MLFNTVHTAVGKISREDWTVIKALRVEKIGAHTTFWKNLWAEAGSN